MAGKAEAFDPHSSPGPHLIKADAPLSVWQLFRFFQWPLLLLLPLLSTDRMQVDFSSRAYTILYAYPLRRGAYLGGKFANGLLWAGLAILALAGGIWAGRIWPGVNAELLGKLDWGSYAFSLGSLAANLLAIYLLLFAIVLRYRTPYTAYATLVVIWLLGLATEHLLGGFGQENWAALFDPLSAKPVALATRYWTTKMVNGQQLPLTVGIITNQLLLWGLGAAVLAMSWRTFAFVLPDQKQGQSIQPALSLPITFLPRSVGGKRFSLVSYLVSEQLYYILRSRMFYLLLGLGAAFLIFQQHNQNPAYGFDLLPATWHLLGRPALVYSGFIIIMTFLYTGMLLHRGQQTGMQDLLSACPVPNMVWLGAALVSIMLLQALWSLVFMACGLGVQFMEGYDKVHLSLYLRELFLLHGLGYFQWAVLSLLVYTLLSRWQTGLLVLLLISGGISALPELGVTSYLLRLFQAPGYTYSDWNAYGGSLLPYLAYKSYWCCFALLLLVLTEWWWRREYCASWRDRWRLVRSRWGRKRKAALLAALIPWLLTGAWLYREEQAAAASQPITEMQWRARLEQQFGQLREQLSPKITHIALDVMIQSDRSEWKAEGVYQLKNSSSSPIDTVLVYHHPLVQFALEWPDGKAFRLPADPLPGISLWHLEQPLLPDSSTSFHFRLLQKKQHWLAADGPVGQNTTVLSDGWFPSIGYPSTLEISHPQQRRQYKLPARSGDNASTQRSYSGAAADRLHLQVSVQVPTGYTALAPGRLVHRAATPDYVRFHYQTQHPIKPNFAIHGGQYALRLDSLGGRQLRTYYHPDHAYNIKVLQEGLQAALAYAEKQYGPCLHEEWRIIEFPLAEGSHATLMDNQLLFSEAYFLFDREEASIDLPFYVAAHEAAHHWWGNQLLPADAPGAKMLTESLAEYTALRVLRSAKGEEAYQTFLDYNRDLYLSQRQADDPPLYLAEAHQKHLHYRKGAIAFCALADCWGEEALNQELSCFLEDHSMQGPPYPIASDLLGRLKTAVPDSLQSLLSDYFEQYELPAHNCQRR